MWCILRCKVALIVGKFHADCGHRGCYLCMQEGRSAAVVLMGLMVAGAHCPPKRSKKVMISSHVLNSSLPHCTTVPMKLGMA